MSDLAPFVAAVLRDKTLQELQAENNKLRKELKAARSVEVTGPNGSPVYARGQIDKDGHPGGNPNLWQVDLKAATKEMFHLSGLADLEIRVAGGMKQASFVDGGEFETSFHLSDTNDTDTSKAIQFCFSRGSGGLWLSCVVQNWPRDQWTALLQDQEPEDGLEYLTETLAQQEPATKTVNFLEICFFRDETKVFLERLDIAHTGQDMEDNREVR